MLKRLKEKIQEIYRYIIGMYLMVSKPNRFSGKAVYANFSDVNFEETYGSLAIRAAEAGYKVFILHNQKLITDYYKRFQGEIMLKWKNIHLTFKNINVPPSSLLFKSADNRPDKIVKISADSFPILRGERELSDREIIYPFDFDLQQFKNPLPIYNINNDRRIRIGFAGNLSPKHFTNSRLSDSFKILNRFDAFEAIRTALPQQVTIAKSPADYFPTSPTPIILGGVGHPHIPNAIPKDYLRFLKQLDFFLALPGTHIPHSHNLIEALAMGCIPILSYGKLMPVALQNNVDCLAYQSKEELIAQVMYALSLSANEVKLMRQNVVQYYGKNLSKQFRSDLFNHKIYEVDKMYVISSP